MGILDTISLPRDTGELGLITGVMGSGKTANLLLLYSKAQHSGYKLFAASPVNKRDEEGSQRYIKSRISNLKIEVPTFVSGEDLYDQVRRIERETRNPIHVIFLDELNLADPDNFFDGILKLRRGGRVVLASSLLHDYRGERYPHVHEFLRLAGNNVRHLTAHCQAKRDKEKCSNEATYSARVYLVDNPEQADIEFWHPTLQRYVKGQWAPYADKTSITQANDITQVDPNKIPEYFAACKECYRKPLPGAKGVLKIEDHIRKNPGTTERVLRKRFKGMSDLERNLTFLLDPKERRTRITEQGQLIPYY